MNNLSLTLQKMMVPALAAGLVLGVAGVSHAQMSFDVTQPSNTSPGGAADNFYAGVTTNSGSPFTASLIQLNSPQTFNSDSSVSFGQTSVVGANSTAGTFTAVPTNFTFDITAASMTGITRQFQVQGNINGTVSLDANGNGASNAFFTPFAFLVDGVNTPFVTVISPAGRVSDLLQGLSFGGTNVDVYVDQRDALTTPGPNAPLTIGGFVATSAAAVPEPGSVALMVGMGLSGAGFLARRRKQGKNVA